MYPIVLPGVAIERLGDDVLKDFALTQNYPNPFNTVTTITFDLPQSSMISLKIFDLQGKEAAVLASGSYPAGRYQTTWDAIGFSNGLYVYQLKTDSYSQEKTMLLLK